MHAACAAAHKDIGKDCKFTSRALTLRRAKCKNYQWWTRGRIVKINIEINAPDFHIYPGAAIIRWGRYQDGMARYLGSDDKNSDFLLDSGFALINRDISR